MPKTPDYFAGKTIIITGAASGIGRATALIFARENANVVCADIDENGVKETAEKINAIGSQALALTIETGVGHFYSRSRRKLWKKGEESGNVLRVTELLTDCDQDVVWLKARVEGDGVACHTGAVSCFYRALLVGGPAAAARLSRTEG